MNPIEQLRTVREPAAESAGRGMRAVMAAAEAKRRADDRDPVEVPDL